MAEPSQPADDDVRQGDDIDEVLSHANPNTERIDCPPRDTLVGLARRSKSIDDPGFEHLVKCSPCYREFRELQAVPAPAASFAVTRGRWAAVAAVVALAIGAAAVWVVIGDRTVLAPASTGPTQVAELRTELDLRQFATTRSEQAGARTTPVELPIGLVELTLLMPVGSEVGAYEVQLLDANLQSKASSRGVGEIRDFVTSIRTTIDLRALTPGTYQLAVRQGGADWQLFPARVD